MHKLLSPFRQSKLLNTLFLSNIFISFHYALIIYINSSYLNNFFTETQVSTIYIIGSIVNTILLLDASKILEKIGIYKFTVYALLIEFLATLGLLVSDSPFLIGSFFLIHLITISLLLFNMDVLVESLSKDKETGGIRATYLTLTNITIVITPLLIAALLAGNNFSYVYLLSALFLIPLYYFVKQFKKIKTSAIKHIKIKETILEYVNNTSLYNIFVSQFLLQLFYAYMVIYTPIYLTKHIGFSWPEVGIMFTIMLLPFIIFELPVGEMEDRKHGEKEFLTIGFIIMGLSTLFISFLTVKIFWMWAVILFITRIGASLVEISTESYFFKHVNKEKTDVISFFRISRPLSFIIAPLLVALTLQFIAFQYIFMIIGSLMIVGAHYSLALSNSK